MTKYPIIDTSASKPQPRRVTGQYVARARLNRQQRSEFATAAANGSVNVFPLTVKQAATLWRVPALDVTRARRANGHGNGKANGRSKPEPSETLAQHILRSSPTERTEAARIIGVDVVWDTMIVPIVTAERAAE